MKKLKDLLLVDRKIPLAGMVTGVLIGYALTCIFFIATALFLRFTDMQETAVPIIVTISCIISVIVAGMDTARSAENNGWLWGICAGGLYAVILMLIGAWAIQGYAIDLRSLTLIAFCLAGGGIGGILGINLKKK